MMTHDSYSNPRKLDSCLNPASFQSLRLSLPRISFSVSTNLLLYSLLSVSVIRRIVVEVATQNLPKFRICLWYDFHFHGHFFPLEPPTYAPSCKTIKDKSVKRYNVTIFNKSYGFLSLLVARILTSL